MIIETTPKVVSIEKLKEKRANAEKGILEYQEAIAGLDNLTPEEIVEAERIKELLDKLKNSKKLQAKQNALTKQQERFAAFDEVIKSWEAEGKTEGAIN